MIPGHEGAELGQRIPGSVRLALVCECGQQTGDTGMSDAQLAARWDEHIRTIRDGQQ